MARSDESAEIGVEIRHVSDNALLLNDGSVEAWIPKSQILNLDEYPDLEAGDQVTLEIRGWVLEAEGFA